MLNATDFHHVSEDTELFAKTILGLFYHWYGSWCFIWNKLSVSYIKMPVGHQDRGLSKWNTPLKHFSFSCLMRRSQYSTRWVIRVFYHRHKYACPLLWGKILSLSYWTVHMPALCSGGRHFLCLPRLFTVQSSLQRQSGTVSASARKMYRNSRDPWRIISQHQVDPARSR